MSNEQENSFEAIRNAGTSAPDFDLDTDEIIARLREWEDLCEFRVKSASADSIEIEFKTLPDDMESFAHELYDFCPDAVDDLVANAKASDEDADEEEMEDMDEDFEANDDADDEDEDEEEVDEEEEDEDEIGVKELKKELERTKSITLSWE